jgi:Putative Flp pilus-assembly TadE/G-like
LTPNRRMLRRRFSHFRLCSTGNVSLIAALTAVPLLGSAGVAIDFIRANQITTKVRSALDSAVLAGAAASADHAKVAERYFNANFPYPGIELASLSFTVTGDTRVEGNATLEVATTFTGLLGINEMEIAVKAAAETTAESHDLCILVLSPSESQALLANSGADVNANSCEIHVKSTANPAVIVNAGTSIKTHRACLQGTKVINNGGTFTNLETGCATSADPYAGKIAAPASSTCTYNNLNYSGNVTLNPGVYCGWFNFNSGPKVTLNPGTYVIKSGG